MFIFIAFQHAESGRFPFNLVDLARLKDPINKTLAKLNNLHKQMLINPDGQKTLQRILPPLEAVIHQQTQAGLMAPPSTIPNSEEIATRFPKGLRMEDLKPPPNKRQKGAAGRSSLNGNTGSPASPAFVSTPEAIRTPRTPRDSGESPAAINGSGKRGGTGKRKRQASRTITGLPVSADNALGINLDEHAPFFAAHDALRASMSSEPSMQPQNGDVWSSLLTALDAYQVASTAPQNSHANFPAIPGVSGIQNSNVANMADMGDLGGMMAPVPEEDLFEQFLDVSKMDEAAEWTLPTPELFRAVSNDDSEPSPESVRTIAKTPAGEDTSRKTVIEGSGLGLGKDAAAVAGRGEPTVILGGVNSPESQAYNGMVFANWGEEMSLAS